jgi:surfactin synthase thioesterase subunit
VGEIGGGFMGGTLATIVTQDDEPSMALIYLFALLGAVMGAVIAFAIAKSLSPVQADEKYGSRQLPTVAPPAADAPRRSPDDRFRA